MEEKKAPEAARKMPTGITGFDEITSGGLPRGGITVVLGGPGAGKTIFGMQVLSTGVCENKEAGILVAFEENAEKILQNTAGFSWGGDALKGKGIQILDAQLPQTVEKGGEFDLVGLLAMLSAAAKQLEAQRIVFDGIDVLLGYLDDPAHVRREMFRIREWVHASGLSAIVTAKSDLVEARGASQYDFLQFMADCVVTLHHGVIRGTALRTLRVSKYRGAAHSANEFPRATPPSGLEIAASPKEVAYPASSERVSTGIERLDAMLSGGYYRGSSVLITGAPGTAKSSLSAAFAAAAVLRGERTLYVTFDESPAQIVRNAASIGIRLAPHVEAGTLTIQSLRGRAENPEAHVARLRGLLRDLRPRNLVVDPLSAFEPLSSDSHSSDAALEVFDLAKDVGVTLVSTSLLGSSAALSEQTPLHHISTMADAWMHVSYVNQGGERNRALTIIKARGTGHSNQVRELILSDAGLTLTDVYSAGGEVLMGTLRWEKENEARRARAILESSAMLREQKAELALAATNAQIDTLARARAIQETELQQIKTAVAAEDEYHAGEADELLHRRQADRARPSTEGERKHKAGPLS